MWCVCVCVSECRDFSRKSYFLFKTTWKIETIIFFVRKDVHCKATSFALNREIVKFMNISNFLHNYSFQNRGYVFTYHKISLLSNNFKHSRMLVLRNEQTAFIVSTKKILFQNLNNLFSKSQINNNLKYQLKRKTNIAIVGHWIVHFVFKYICLCDVCMWCVWILSFFQENLVFNSKELENRKM